MKQPQQPVKEQPKGTLLLTIPAPLVKRLEALVETMNKSGYQTTAEVEAIGLLGFGLREAEAINWEQAAQESTNE